MSSVPTLIAELLHLNEWVTVQVNAGIDATQVAEQQFKVLKTKISFLPKVDIPGATQLVAKIKEVALPQWTAANIIELTSAVGEKTGCDTFAKPKYQENVFFELYLTKG